MSTDVQYSSAKKVNGKTTDRMKLKPATAIDRFLSCCLAGLLAIGPTAAHFTLIAAWLTAVPMAHASPPVVTLTRVHSFGDPLTDAANPQSRVREGSDGVLYGTTVNGGSGALAPRSAYLHTLGACKVPPALRITHLLK